jgi:uncharacterized membrane-anchored protein
MQKCHVPLLGLRYWTALCLASVFGANMGDFFAHNLGLGHVAGLPSAGGYSRKALGTSIRFRHWRT